MWRRVEALLLDDVKRLVRKTHVGWAKLRFFELGLAFGDIDAVRLALDAALAEFGKGTEEADEIQRIVLQLLLQNGWVEVSEKQTKLAGNHLEVSFVDFTRVLLPQDIESELFFGATKGSSLLVFEPLLIAAFFPAGQMVGLQAFAGIAEFLDDDGVGDTIVNHQVDLFPELRGKTTDFAGVAVEVS